MSVEEALEKMTHNIETNAQNIDRKIEDRLEDPNENVEMLARQARGLAQQVESLCTIIRKIEEYE